MIKISKRYLGIFMFLIILILAVTGCSKNPVTDSYGPSWNMMLELPVTNQEDNLNEIVEADQFDNMGITTAETSIESLYVIGTEDKPIKKSIAMDLPELNISLNSGINVNETIGLENGSADSISLTTIAFPDLTLGNSGNKITITIENTGLNQIDDITFEIWDKNTERTGPIATANFTNVNGSNSKDLILNNKIIKEDDLELKISYEQSSGPTTADITMSGLQNITIKKVDNLEVTDVSVPGFDNITLELGVFESIDNYYNVNSAELKLAIREPESMNMEFNFDEIAIASIPGTDMEDYFLWTDNSSISLGTVSLSGSLNMPSDNTISYNATDNAKIDVEIKGKAEKTEIPSEYENEINIENGDLVYNSEPMEVDISQDDIDTMREGVIDLDETYLETIINNKTGLELAAEVYIGSVNNKDQLYSDQNKVNERLLEVQVDENEPKRFLLKNALDKVEDTLTEGNVYMGIKFIAGELDVNTGIDIIFTDNMSINIKSSVYVKMRINQ